MSHADFTEGSRANAIAARNAYVEWKRDLFRRRPPNPTFTRPNPSFLRSLFAAGYSRQPADEADARKLSQMTAWGQLG